MKKIKPMLARLGTEKDLNRKGWIYEPKIDGTRAILYKFGRKIKILNRRGIWIENRYPELLKVDNFLAKNVIVDGEIAIVNPKTKRPDFYKLEEREHQENKLKIEILSEKYPVTYFVFDILNLNGKNIEHLKLSERKKILEKYIKNSNRIEKIYYTENGKTLWNVVKKFKLEGIMAKNFSSVYEEGRRSENWLKIKLYKTLDVIVLGWTEGKGERKNLFGSLLTGIYYNGNIAYTGRVGTGFSNNQTKNLLRILKKLETKKKLYNIEIDQNLKIHWVKPKIVIETKFMSLTKDIRMRAPSFQRIRMDKIPDECTIDEQTINQLIL